MFNFISIEGDIPALRLLTLILIEIQQFVSRFFYFSLKPMYIYRKTVFIIDFRTVVGFHLTNPFIPLSSFFMKGLFKANMGLFLYFFRNAFALCLSTCSLSALFALLSVYPFLTSAFQ